MNYCQEKKLPISPFFHNNKIEIQRHHSSMPCSRIVKVRLYLNDARDSVASPTVSANGNFRQDVKFPELYDKRTNWPHADAGNSL